MSKRIYQQYCGLAAALDVVGQRWALLIVRDLAPGPRRFTDLFDGLPGISTDLLADRLRSLEAAGAVTKREIRDPAPAKLYELTDRGRELARLAGELARWGGPLLPPVDEAGDRITNARWPLQQRAARYRGGFEDGDVHIVLDGERELTLSLTGARASLRYGHQGTEPLLTIQASTPTMLGFLRTAPTQAELDRSDLEASGRTELLVTLFEALQV
ncbi:MAG: helix-turn-helix domain-containing protein [Actinomycetota bacterium]